MFKQPFLSPEIAAITYKVAVAADNTMAGNDDADAVVSIGSANSPYRFGIADAFAEFEVTDGAAIRDLAQFGPYRLLKLSARLRHMQVEFCSFA